MELTTLSDGPLQPAITIRDSVVNYHMGSYCWFSTPGEPGKELTIKFSSKPDKLTLQITDERGLEQKVPGDTGPRYILPEKEGYYRYVKYTKQIEFNGGSRMILKEKMIVPFQQWINDKAHWGQLTDYMLKESHLPGPRANLELSDSFTGHFAKSDTTDTAWELLTLWANSLEAEVDTNDPRVFLSFCAVRACGAYYGYTSVERRDVIRRILKSAMNDSRWRMREAAAMGLQSIGEHDFTILSQLLDTWKLGANQLEQRAFVAALAHPPLLKVQANTLYCLSLASEIMQGISKCDDVQEDPEHFRVLSKGLEYSLSVFVASEPVSGFAMLRNFAKSGEPRIVKIVKSNLGKARLSKKYGSQVADLLMELTMK